MSDVQEAATGVTEDAVTPQTPVAAEPEQVVPAVVTEIVPEPVVESAAEPVAETVTETVTETEPVAEQVVESAAEAASAEAPAESPESEKPAGSKPKRDSGVDGKRVVRTLAEGQEVKGTVKRISEFGAFVDIGVGRDGLVHISELSVKRVGKVTDVLAEGQEVTLWIKKLDRDRNRISLTMIPPGTTTIRDLDKDDIVTGTVTRILPYGAFVDIGVGRDALLHVREMGDRYIAKPEEVVKVGEVIEARIIEIQRRRGRIDLSIKGLRPEPEAEPVAESAAPAAAAAEAPAAEDEPVDSFADIEPVSTMEEAFRRAYAASNTDFASSSQSDKARRKEKQRAEQEAIFERTLKQGK